MPSVKECKKRIEKRRKQQASVSVQSSVEVIVRDTQARREEGDGLCLRCRFPSVRSFTTLNKRARSPSRSVPRLDRDEMDRGLFW